MGRNADKRRARRDVETSVSVVSATVSGEPMAQDMVSAAAVVGAATSGPLARASSGIGAPWHAPPPALDGSLSHALFRLSCILAMHPPGEGGADAKGYARLVEELRTIVNADAAALVLLPGPGIRTFAAGARGASSLLALLRADQTELAALMGDTVDVVVFDDAPRQPGAMALFGAREDVGSAALVALGQGHEALGYLVLTRREIRAFSPHDVEVVRRAAATVALDLAQVETLYRALRDPLTDVGSRFSLLLSLPREVEIARRYRGELSLLLIDGDGLTSVNTAQGRAAGDACLQAAARHIGEALRAADLVVRMGASTFAVLLPMTPSNAARALGKRLVRSLAAAPLSQAVGWSIGTASLAPDEDALSFLARCDEALLEAKAAGGGTVVTASVVRAGPSG